MSRYFPHTAYAEDQPLAHTILGVHVLTRFFTVGTIAGAAISGLRQFGSVIRGSTSASSPAAAASAVAAAAKRAPFSQRLVLSAANGSIVGVGVGSAMLAARMYGRSEIEWRDRSWRLMEHRGQLETDDWTYAGMAAGLGAAVVARRSRPLVVAAGWRGLLGAAALGGIGGTVGYVGWRHGINGGVFPGENGKDVL